MKNKQKEEPLIINMYLHDTKEFFQDYKLGYDGIISDECHSFLLNRAKAAEPGVPIEIIIHSKKISKVDENTIRMALYNSFEISVLKILKEKKKLIKQMVVNLIVGFLLFGGFLVFYDYLPSLVNFIVIAVAGIFIEMMISTYLFEFIDKKKQVRRNMSLRDMCISFTALD